MFIETEGTPNPATLKFLPGREVMGFSTADFASAGSAARSPLASALFALPGVARVFLGGDFISVTRNDEQSWQALKPQVLGAIMDHFVAGRPVIEGDDDLAEAEDVDPADQEVVDQIKELLDTRVRPAVAGDGGDIVFRGYRAGHRAPAYAGVVLRLSLLKRDLEARHREHAAALCSRGRGGRAGRILIGSKARARRRAG